MMKILRVFTLCCIVVAFEAQRREGEAEPNYSAYGAVQPASPPPNEALEIQAIRDKLQQFVLGFVNLKTILDTVTAETIRLHATFKQLKPLDATRELITRITNLRNRLLSRMQPSSNGVQNAEKPVYTIVDQNTGETITVDVSPEVPKDSEFLDEHNFYRQRLREGTDPEGYHVPGLADLIWDRELAAECRRWAETCVYQYAQNINAEENLASTTNVIGDPVQLWYAYRNKTGHYRKMVSPTAVYLGCHMTRCAVLQLVQAGVNQTNAYYTVCRYSTIKTMPTE